MMINIAKRIASTLPSSLQQSLQRQMYKAKIRSGKFVHTEQEYKRLAEWVSAGDVVLDIGANVGIYSARLSELVGAHGQVFCFEPIPRTFQLLCSNSQCFPHKNVTLLNVAASDSAGIVRLEVPSFSNGLKAFTRASITDAPSNSADTISAYSVVVDGLQIAERIAFVKIDVEGHELGVLRGMEQTLRQSRPVLVVEGEDSEVQDFLINKIGYRKDQAAGSENCVYLAD